MTLWSTAATGKTTLGTLPVYSGPFGRLVTVSPVKCHFRQEEVTYLRYIMGGGKLRLLIDKVEAVFDTPTPKTKKQVHQFLGLATYYQHILPDFVMTAAPAFDLTKSS